MIVSPRKRSEPELGPGEVVGQYRLEEALGEGGMGIVFRAVREPDGQIVALKVLRRALSADESYQHRFLREARVASEVRHRHLVPILDAGEANGRFFLAAEYVAGGSLEGRIASAGKLPLDEVVRVAAQVGSALDALHQHGLVHRDVKPANVLIRPDGSAVLTDFGLAKGRAYTVLTKPGQVMGTIDYLAPELIRGGQAGPASDMYALACLLYECLTGGPPFADRSILQVGMAHLDEQPADPCAGRDDAPPSVGWVILQGLEKDPERRPPTATALSHMLAAAVKTGSR